MANQDQVEALLEAAKCGDVHFLSALIKKGVDMSSKNLSCSGLFDIAYTNGHKEFVYKLLEAGFDVDSIVIDDLPRSHSWQTLCLPFVIWFKVYREALKGHGKLCKAIFEASFKHEFHMIDKHLKQVHSCWKSGTSSTDIYSVLLFLLVCNSECPSRLLQILIDAGAKVNTTFHGFRICDYTVLCGNANGLKILLKNNCLIDEDGSGSFSNFHHAVIFSKVDCLDLLLCNTDLSTSKIWKENGAELLTLALKYGKDSCVDLLLKYDACVERTDQNELNNSPLLIASKTGNLTCLDLLLKHGANVNISNDAGETPLIYTAVFGHLSCLDTLLSHNANINAVDCDNQTALMHALQRGNTDCVCSLISKGADTSIVNNNNETALIHAVSLHDEECLELVLSSEQEQFRTKNLRLNKLHYEAFALALRQFDVESLLMFLKYGFFSWKWMDSIVNEGIQTEILARVLVVSNIPPGHFQIHQSTNPKTLFQSALASQDIWTAHYLLANLYLDEYDLVYLHQQQCFIQESYGLEQNTHAPQLLNSLVSRPLPLQVLCILNLSFGLGFDHMNAHSKRTQIIQCLPIPGKFKKILNFQGPYSNLCVDKWKALGTQMSQRGRDGLMLSMKITNIEMGSCEDGLCGDNARGFRMRYDLLKKRTQRCMASD